MSYIPARLLRTAETVRDGLIGAHFAPDDVDRFIEAAQEVHAESVVMPTGENDFVVIAVPMGDAIGMFLGHVGKFYDTPEQAIQSWPENGAHIVVAAFPYLPPQWGSA